jgi:hypothetical protein
MSDQPKEQAPKKRPAKGRDLVAPESTPVDAAVVAAVPEPALPAPEPEPACVSDPAPTIAAAALAEAIEGARKPSEAPAPERASESAAVKVEARPIDVPPRAVTPPPTRPRYALQAAAVILALGAGWVGGSHLGAGTPASATAPAWAEAASAGIRDNRDDVVRLAGDVRALKVTLEALKDGLDKPRPEAGTRQVMERLERSERVALDASARLVKVAEQLDRIEREPAKAAGSLTERLERIERQVIATANTVAASAPVPVAAAAKAATPIPDPTQTASLPKPDPRQTRIEGWVLLEVYDGAALVESRNKAHEVAPGQTLPGVGKVLAIEKRGKAWMVVTDKGFIGAEVR